uniref:Uncharacterized protein n=1 Tax=Oryza glumipatula TaxID=40148 RepID=A0A0D9Z643_9ORYZ
MVMGWWGRGGQPLRLLGLGVYNDKKRADAERRGGGGAGAEKRGGAAARGEVGAKHASTVPRLRWRRSDEVELASIVAHSSVVNDVFGFTK